MKSAGEGVDFEFSRRRCSLESYKAHVRRSTLQIPRT